MICCIGHITHDRIVTPDFTTEMPGGTAYYFAKTLRNLAPGKFRIITAIGDDEQPVVNCLREDGIEIKSLPSKHSVFFENIYGKDIEDRVQRVLAKATPFDIESLRDEEAEYFHLGTLLAEDFDIEVVKYLSKRGKVSLDIQGYLRSVDGENVIHKDFPYKYELMQYVSVLKANEKEMEVLTGESDPYKAAVILSGWGCKEVVLTLGSKGSLIMSDGKFYRIPAFPPRSLTDSTGCGDTYMAGYLYRRSEGDGIAEAGRYAAALCSLKLACKGPLDCSCEDVEEILRNAHQAPVA